MLIRDLEAKQEYLDQVAVLDLTGEISSTGEKVLRQAYQEAKEYGSPTILLNMEGVDYINSTGIALIVRVISDARSNGRRIAVCGLTDHYMEIFRITRLSEFVDLFSDRETALAALLQQPSA